MDFSWLAAEGLDRLPHFLTSLGLGLLMGLERERNPSARAGLRTFALVALLGTVCAVLSQSQAAPWLTVAGLLTVGAMIIVAYLDAALLSPGEAKEDPGTTTSAALVLCFALGAMVAYGFDRLAVMLAIAATVLLYFKPELKGLAQNLERRDLVSILQFAVVSFIILPILPDRAFGPYSALNARQIWLMVVLISGVSLAGYLALRIVGRRHGAALLGLFGGLVSSTATTLVYARHGRSAQQLYDLSSAVIVLANLVVLGRLAVLTAVVSPALLPSLLPVLGCALLPGAASVAYRLRRLQSQDEPPMPAIGNPTELRTALVFALVYALVLLVAAWLHDRAGAAGLYSVALISGLTDVDAITLSALRLFGLGSLAAPQAITCIGLAFLANIGFKLGLIGVSGGVHMLRRCLPGLAATAVGAAVGLRVFA
ncbi:MAG TPA: MgtC/SapB family protein [Burkholderiales bacterium]|nr:MgtC/SapB family protein [Burkholderiales bacterium]